MPNHVNNQIVFTGTVDDVAAIKQLMVVEKLTERPFYLPDDKEFVPAPITEFDFNQIIPQPEILNRVCHPLKYGPNNRVMVFDQSSDGNSKHEREASEAEQGQIVATTSQSPILPNDIIEYTMPTWYNWRVANWGTKWNSYDFQEVANSATYSCSFDTAWAAPNPIFDKIAEQFPNVTIDLGWFDEGWMHAGKGVMGPGGTPGSSENFYTEASADIYEEIYGVRPISEEEMEEQYILDISTPTTLRLADNFTCYDVLASMNTDGYYPIDSVSYSDDPIVFEDDLSAMQQMRARIAIHLGING